jgi:hypothetical protein
LVTKRKRPAHDHIHHLRAAVAAAVLSLRTFKAMPETSIAIMLARGANRRRKTGEHRTSTTNPR